MITKPTVFIVGAGASVPYGFPTGNELLGRIERQQVTVDGITGTFNADREKFRRALIGSGSPSIDDFLQDNPQFVEMGKIIIAAALVPAENDNRLIGLKAEHWLRELWAFITAKPDQFVNNRIGFIVYNYDRCIEHYLTVALANSHGISLSAAWKLVSQIPIIHPHGHLGEYIPSDVLDPGHLGTRQFNPNNQWESINRAMKSIRLYWEKSDEQAEVRKKMHEIIVQAERIVFLGFGFLPSNLEHLTAMLGANGYPIYGTNLKLPKQRTDMLKTRYLDRLHFFPCDCATLLLDHVPFWDQ